MSAGSWPRPGAAGNAPRSSGNASRYCGSIFAARATFAHFSSSFLMCAANCAGVLLTGSARLEDVPHHDPVQRKVAELEIPIQRVMPKRVGKGVVRKRLVDLLKRPHGKLAVVVE
jgi:hypothetical protein